ncbi:Uncharacterised protein [Campylobacter ureolyticus]|uniref:Uncharacterized protein n=2 Tax=Campylobacter ureolyticus TaxID=827 RepID=A0A6N2SZ60_9BACT
MFGKSSIFKILLYFITTMITILSISFIVVSMEAILMYNPKPIEKLNKKTGIIQDYHFNLKNSRGYLHLKTFDNNLIKFTIRADDKKIYEKLKSKKIIVYSSNNVFINYIQQIEDENKTIYKKYDYEAELNSINVDIKIIKTAIFFIIISVILIFITNLKGPKPKSFKKYLH